MPLINTISTFKMLLEYLAVWGIPKKLVTDNVLTKNGCEERLYINYHLLHI